MRPRPGVELVRTPARTDDVDALADAAGGRVGLVGLLDDLDRRARAAGVPGRGPAWGFRWDLEDQLTRRWWPQGIDTGLVAGREVVLTTAYAKPVAGVRQGCRLTVTDISDPRRLRYRHVLLVETVVDEHGAAHLRPVRAHAGGLVWHGPHLHVARTARGLCCFRLDDIVRVPAAWPEAHGYRYLLPLRFEYRARTRPGTRPLRYSFISLDHTAASLLAGEYGRGGMSTRLAHYDLDPDTSLLRAGPDRVSRPASLADAGVQRMQGAVHVDGCYYLTTSAGRLRRGSLWLGGPGAFRRHPGTLPAGPEDLAYCPATDRLWSLSEHRGRRYVFAIDRGRFS